MLGLGIKVFFDLHTWWLEKVHDLCAFDFLGKIKKRVGISDSRFL